MRSLLKFIYKYHYFILFILLQIVAFVFLVQSNNYQRATLLNSSSKLAGKAYSSAFSITQYFNLKDVNQDLVRELESYKNLDKGSYYDNRVSLIDIYDSVLVQQYQFVAAQVLNNSVNKQNNYITLNKGLAHGIGPGMAVVSNMGVVGVVKESSNKFSSIISILNQNLRISAMVKKNNYFGTILWEGGDYRKVKLLDLPNHITLQTGDTIITSGYSAIFPKGQLIGVVESIEEKESGNFYEANVLLSEDFKNLSEVFVVKNYYKKEQLELERKANHD